ncbi:hypothetical protein CEXT_45181 [Caerostris extrusa]|uniref:Uncharacterized protein n=1 Tax=Caerostris extrusa TaxID=172846 RepID=A0AAV4URR8_CAEEX|nr:hypothetical protein CEXT_45181 [Caerostris extrusa]
MRLRNRRWRPPPNDSRVNSGHHVDGETNTAKGWTCQSESQKTKTPSTVAVKKRNWRGTLFSWKRSSAESKRLSGCLQLAIF